MTNIDIIANLSTVELIVAGVTVLVTIIAVVGLIIDNGDRKIKVAEFDPNYPLVVCVMPLANGASECYCDDGHTYYAPIGSHLIEGDVICKANFLKIK